MLEAAELSPTARPFLDNFTKHMLLPDGGANWDEHRGISCYGGPSWKDRQIFLDLALRMWQLGMLAYT